MSDKNRLPMLAERRRALETCSYCPKLCRAACPVSNATAKETHIPWGKMSLAWFASRGDVPVEPAYAQPAWACTGCMACRESCDHRNPVADTLADARADFMGAGVAPPSATAVTRRHPERIMKLAAAIERLRASAGVSADATTAVLMGCGYALDAEEEGRDALAVLTRLLGKVSLVDGCCGAPLLHAGDRAGFLSARRRIEDQVGSAELVCVDPGCAVVFEPKPPPESARPRVMVQIVADALDQLGRVDLGDAPVRWQDPCQLGRGLGVYQEPRRVLAHVLGREPDEFARTREQAVCAGSGGLLPVTMPAASRSIAQARLGEHDRLGGGSVVTGCASSLRRLRSVGARVMDIGTIIRRALEANG